MKIYLWINAVVYFLLAAWCTFKPAQTSTSLGFVQLNPSGRSEYLVIYGGLQLGLALFFAWLALKPEFYRAGLMFSLFLYAPLVVYRSITLAQNWPVGQVTIGTAAVEWALFLPAIVLWLRMK